MTILKTAPRLLCIAIARGNFSLLTLTLDMAVPPLSLLAMLLILMFTITGIATALGFAATALIISTACLVGSQSLSASLGRSTGAMCCLLARFHRCRSMFWRNSASMVRSCSEK